MDSMSPIKSIDIHDAGNGCQIRFGDLSGDGRMDYLLVKPSRVSDERYFAHSIVCATAYSVDGGLLWQKGDPCYDSPVGRFDVPAQIYDIDRDGKNEVILIMNEEILILDGKTGETKKSVPLPDQFACDSITIADLEGTGYPQNILIKNKYSKLWALDSNLNILWSFEGNIGHTPAVFDINGDGKDEIIAGYNVLTSSGELLWKADMPKHANSISVCNFGVENNPTIIFCGPYVAAYSVSGELLWTIDEESNSVCIAKFRENAVKEEILLMDSLSLFSCDGEFLLQKNEKVYLPAVLYDFDKSGKTYIVGHKKEDIVTSVYDGYMRTAYTLETFGNIVCCDLLGDGHMQIIIYGSDTLDIYSPYDIDFSEPIRPYMRKQPRQYYNASVFNFIPKSQFAEGYISDDFASQNILKWADSYANVYLHSSFAKVTRAEFITLLISLLNLKEDFDENFSDVTPDSTYYQSVGTAKALGIIESDDNFFRPDETVTVSYAKSILDKLGIAKTFGFDENYTLSKQDLARLIISLKEQ
ncbi:MAG: S-layer homology domain-containing protein [Clostridia bacterium]|nr:S-layer homology domain-containing protein [Clostridia bacterium]